MNRRTPPAIWLDHKRPTKEVLAELGLERRTAYMRYGPRGTAPGPAPTSRPPRSRVKRRRCPCCGTEASLLVQPPLLSFGPTTQAIFNAVRDSEYGLTAVQLAERVYGNGDAGPIDPVNNVRVLIARLNKALAKVGLKLHNGTWGGAYHLVEK